MQVSLTTVVLVLVAQLCYGDPLNCDLTAYKPQPGLTASVAGETLTVSWDGDRTQQVRLRFAIENGTPTIQQLALAVGGQWRRWRRA